MLSLHCFASVPSMVRNQTASLEASWNANNLAWLVEVAITMCFTDFHEIGTPFFRKIYHVCDLPSTSSVLMPESTYPTISVVLVFLK